MFSIQSVLFLIGVLSTVAFCVPIDDERIFGGHEAKPGQFPYQISLRLNHTGSFRHICGGSIISDRFILTAGHCIPPQFSKPNLYRVVVGAHRRENDGQKYLVKRFIIHPAYNLSQIIHDIALIELAAPIEFSETIGSIPLHKEFVDGAVRSVTSGWGRTNVSLHLIQFNIIVILKS